jgi:hypothetical protein
VKILSKERFLNDEDELLEDAFDNEYFDAGEVDMGEEDELESEDEEEVEKDDGSGESNVTESRIVRCRYCGAEVILDELPYSISRDTFEQFGICLNFKWGIYIQNDGHF